jgi:hypothetical protein
MKKPTEMIFSFKLKRVRLTDEETICKGCVFLVKHSSTNYRCLAAQVLGKENVPECSRCIFVKENNNA